MLNNLKNILIGVFSAIIVVASVQVHTQLLLPPAQTILLLLRSLLTSARAMDGNGNGTQAHPCWISPLLI